VRPELGPLKAAGHYEPEHREEDPVAAPTGHGNERGDWSVGVAMMTAANLDCSPITHADPHTEEQRYFILQVGLEDQL
jgi:hypothetical protein